MKTILKNLFFLLTLCLVFSSCHTREKVVYLQGAEELGVQAIAPSYSAHIKKDDQLTILVNCKEPELAAPFNMQLTPRAFTGGSQISNNYGSGTPITFWVNPEGDIDYPIMGKLHVLGMTRTELSDTIKYFLTSNGYIQDPIVTVNFNNYKISVLGEVTRPGQFNITTDRITLFDAIAMAGDLTIFGERDRIKVIREEDGKQSTEVIDIRDPKIVDSPYYYLHQNDIVYVEPNKTKASNREVSSLYSFGVSLFSLAVTIATFVRSY